MFGINYDKLEDLQKKYNLPDEFIKDYEKQREIDRATGTQLCNSEREYYCVRNVAEQHILEDYRMKFIPTLQDWVEQLPYQPWMNNAISVPARLQGSRETHTTDLTDFSTKTLD